ncbi:tsukushi-like [Antedon mediterranea]|uniref:tsukushi-like n=1 Tax=Antedon mediterranea TaxID=105859 RepID=UPI003AF91BAE
MMHIIFFSDVSSNPIHSIEPFTFINIQLQYVRIQYNHELQELCENAFALNTSFSVELWVANNRNLVNISTGTFKNVTSGSNIYLDRNSLQSIPSKAFQGEPIINMKLEDNNISFIHTDAFVALDSIYLLRLAYNNLKEIPILHANITDTLDLSWNYLTALGDWQLPSVKKIIINKNSIQRISKTVFANISSLEML